MTPFGKTAITLAIAIPSFTTVVLALAACSSEPAAANGTGQGTTVSESLQVHSDPHWVDLGDGHKVRCVYETRLSHDGGSSCDWDHMAAT